MVDCRKLTILSIRLQNDLHILPHPSVLRTVENCTFRVNFVHNSVRLCCDVFERRGCNTCSRRVISLTDRSECGKTFVFPCEGVMRDKTKMTVKPSLKVSR